MPRASGRGGNTVRGLQGIFALRLRPGQARKYGLDGIINSMNQCNETGFASVASKTAAGRFPVKRLAATLTGATMLAGVPFAAYAQDEAVPATSAQTAEPAAPAAPVSNTIRSISVAGAERLEPTTILSYIRLRVGQEYTSAGADDALKDLGATELFSNFSIRNDAGNVVITVTENPVINRIVLEGNDRLDADKILPPMWPALSSCTNAKAALPPRLNQKWSSCRKTALMWCLRLLRARNPRSARSTLSATKCSPDGDEAIALLPFLQLQHQL